ncbi:MAG: ankyrin repeat domain-containing protein [Calditrichaeota bacterium]|nr:ankyrin repeat domain-containing protein [Calditrichota bacterium]
MRQTCYHSFFVLMMGLFLALSSTSFAQENSVDIALVKAAGQGQAGTVKALLMGGANVNVQVYLQGSPQSKSARRGTALTEALQHNGPLQLISTLLDAGADVNIPEEVRSRHNESTYTPLFLAVRLLRVDAVQLLLAKKPRDLSGMVTAVLDGVVMTVGYDEAYNSATVEARAARAIEILRLLLAAGADINEGDGAQRSGLFKAAGKLLVQVRNENIFWYHDMPPALLTYLLENGADVSRGDKVGDTPLINAVISANIEAVKLLLAAGSDVNAQNQTGQTALMKVFAIEENHAAMPDYDHHKEDYVQRKRRLRQLTRQLFQILAGVPEVDLNRADAEGMTALGYIINLDLGNSHVALERSDQLWFIRELLSRGADPNQQDKNGKSALIYAIDKNDAEIQGLIVGALEVEVAKSDTSAVPPGSIRVNSYKSCWAMLISQEEATAGGGYGWWSVWHRRKAAQQYHQTPYVFSNVASGTYTLVVYDPASVNYNPNSGVADQRSDGVVLDKLDYTGEGLDYYFEQADFKAWNCLSCPWLYVFDGARYRRAGEVLQDVVGRENCTSTRLALASGDVIGRRLSIRIQEEKDEISYLDQVTLEVDGVSYPAFRNGQAPQELQAIDGRFLRLAKGEAVELSFELPVPPDAASRLELRVHGYYEPDREVIEAFLESFYRPGAGADGRP